MPALHCIWGKGGEGKGPDDNEEVDPTDIDEDNKAGKEVGDSGDTNEDEGDAAVEYVTTVSCTEDVLAEGDKFAGEIGPRGPVVSAEVSGAGTGFSVSFTSSPSSSSSRLPELTASEALEEVTSDVTSG